MFKKHRSLAAIAIFSFTIATVTSVRTWAALQLPTGLNSADRQQALRLIGLGLATKSLTDPYPLGGYSGFEVGVSLETLPTEDLSRLGNRLTASQSDVTVPKISIGKGLYTGLDFFLHFIPYNQRTELSQYGAALRWGFYEAPSLPISVSVLGHMNTGNINNQVTTRTFGVDLIAGINVNEVSLYTGVGALQSVGGFVGGSNGVTSSGAYETESVNGLHTMVGAAIRISPFFAAVQLDRYSQSILSAKLGVRF